MNLERIVELLSFKHSNFNPDSLIFVTNFGSKLYGLATPESDIDIKGIYLPSKKDCYLQTIKKSFSYKSKSDNIKSKNTSSDIDIEVWSLHYFLHLIQTGDTGALDILHAPINNNDIVLLYNHIWKDIYNNRKLFYTNGFTSLVQYAKKQAAKYGIKGSRLSDARRIHTYIKSVDNSEDVRLSEIWNTLPDGEHITRNPPDIDNKQLYRCYQICGSKFQETVTLQYVDNWLLKFINSYGKRAKKAETNEGIDWKAVSHALRAACQIKQLYLTGDLIWPLEETKFILDVKLGKKDFLTEVNDVLDSIINEVIQLSKLSNYPQTTNKLYWDNFILNIYEQCDNFISTL